MDKKKTSKGLKKLLKKSMVVNGVRLALHEPAVIFKNHKEIKKALAEAGWSAEDDAVALEQPKQDLHLLRMQVSFLVEVDSMRLDHRLREKVETLRIDVGIEATFLCKELHRFTGHTDGSLTVGVVLTAALVAALWWVTWRMFVTGYKLKT